MENGKPRILSSRHAGFFLMLLEKWYQIPPRRHLSDKHSVKVALLEKCALSLPFLSLSLRQKKKLCDLIHIV